MKRTTHSVRTTDAETQKGGRRRAMTAGRALFALVVLNIVVLTAFAIERRSRSDAEFCASCHNMTAHVESYLNSTHMDNAHRRANVGCKSCHADYTVVDEVRSMVAFAMGDYEEVFHRRKFDEEMCIGCHVGLEYQAVRTDHLARNPHRGHYPDLRCGACHLAHARQVDFCGSCHDNGGQRMTGDAVAARAVAPWQRTTTPELTRMPRTGELESVDHD